MDGSRLTILRILGVDPGSRITGFGVIEQRGTRQHYVGSGCIRTGQDSFEQRLKSIFEGLSQVMKEYAPQVVAIEQVFVHKNVASALKLAQVRGVVMLVAGLHSCVVNAYAARRIKKALVGFGAADKNQVQTMIKALFKLDGLPQVDAADALAVALCHAQ